LGSLLRILKKVVIVNITLANDFILTKYLLKVN